MNNFFETRKILGYSRQKAAKLSGISYGTIYRIEHDACDVGHKKIEKLERFYQDEINNKIDTKEARNYEYEKI